MKVFSLEGIQVEGYDVSSGGDEDLKNALKEAEFEDENEEVEAPPLFIKTLCCPITRQPLKDPVVCKKDGVTFEREALIAREGDRGYYPNRALVEYMDPLTNPRNELQYTSPKKKGVFYCSITTDLLRDPVIDYEGNTYERAAIVDWIQQHGVSPITRKPLHIDQLYDNTTLFRVLYHEVQCAPIEIRGSDEIVAWKRDVASFNYLTNTVKPTKILDRDLQAEQPRNPGHPARMRVDYNGRWRQRNKDTVTIVGLLLVCLCVVAFLFFEFPVIAIWCLCGLIAVALFCGLLRLRRSRVSDG